MVPMVSAAVASLLTCSHGSVPMVRVHVVRVAMVTVAMLSVATVSRVVTVRSALASTPWP